MWSWQVNSSVGRSTPRASSPCSCQSSLLINVQVYASQVCRLCPPTNALFQCDLPGPPLPPHSVPPCRRPHCCMPVAPPAQLAALDRPCADRDLPSPVPVTPVCWPNSSRRTGPTIAESIECCLLSGCGQACPQTHHSSQASHTQHKLAGRLKSKQDDACLSEELQSSVRPGPRCGPVGSRRLKCGLLQYRKLRQEA